MLFQQEYEMRWSDVDANFHMRHSVYADICATLRMKFLSEIGFGFTELAREKIGPVLFKETITYLREVPPNDSLIANLRVSGRSKDGRKWRIHHELFRKSDGVKAAEIAVEGAWMNTVLRKLAVPPQLLIDGFEKAERTVDFQEF